VHGAGVRVAAARLLEVRAGVAAVARGGGENDSFAPQLKDPGPSVLTRQ
jgi:hypothetical protein